MEAPVTVGAVSLGAHPTITLDLLTISLSNSRLLLLGTSRDTPESRAQNIQLPQFYATHLETFLRTFLPSSVSKR